MIFLPTMLTITKTRIKKEVTQVESNLIVKEVAQLQEAEVEVVDSTITTELDAKYVKILVTLQADVIFDSTQTTLHHNKATTTQETMHQMLIWKAINKKMEVN